ncbi:LCP family protein [Enterococcus sp. BWT-B8]|uniref:LCP family glycopolymer transferase n=1 Tax=Enterococcus sp. BWT-B8 TaxID=2885157 RepID=UPI001E320EAA|nr:LCP family protein [Enterococcus sp. BWT-B8]MCB5951534.1 LCP family protein [Enterococcus sp. BWT-B8]
MNLWKKLVLSFLGLVFIMIAGICAYGLKIYSDASGTVTDVYESIERVSTKREVAVSIDAQEPFSVLLMGIDNGDLGRTEEDGGRSDTMMVVTINPKENKSTILSLSRDTLTELVGNDTTDKLNHAYAYGGAKMTIDTVENLLDIPIDNYVSINMKGLKDLIDAVGGIDVDNPYDTELDGINLPKGPMTLNGETGLAYARYRYDDPEGDIGRQKRQREVVEKIVNKVLSFSGVTQYKSILNAVKDNVKTDLTWDDMIDIQKKYMNSFGTIESLQLETQTEEIDGGSYQILNADNLFDVQTKLRAQLGLAPNDAMLAELTEKLSVYAVNSGTGYTGDADYYDSGYADPGTTGYSQDYGYTAQGNVDQGYAESTPIEEPTTPNYEINSDYVPESASY